MLLTAFNNMPDYRRNQGKVYNLAPLLTIICIAILARANEYVEIASFVDEKLKVLKKLFDLKWKKAPSYATIRRVCIWSSKQTLEDIFRQYASECMVTKGRHKLVALDGKVLRGSNNQTEEGNAIQVISAFLVEHQIVLGQEEIDGEKTNEIPKVRKLIKELGIEDHVFTMDALHCQYETLQEVVDSGNNAISQVKDNQKKLHKLCQKMTNGWRPIEQNTQTNYDRNRQETRVAKIYRKNQYLRDHIDEKWHKNIECTIKIERTRLVFSTKKQKWEKSYDEAYYIGTKLFTAKDANVYIREHWGIENRLHHVRDRSMREDDCKISFGAGTLSKLRSFVLNILRANGVKNIKNELFKNSVNLNRITKYRFLFN